ncbi:RidA family protein [Clostridium sp. CTA-5]
MLEITNTKKAPQAIGPYSQAISFGNLLFTSGQIALDPTSGVLVGEDIKEQTIQVMENISALLEENNIDFKNVIKTTCFLADMSDFQVFNEVYSKYFVSKPARSCVAVKELPKNALCEVEVIAYK